MAPPWIFSSNWKPSPRGSGRDLDDDVAELAVAARLLLVAALLGDRAADRFAIADRRRVRLHLDPVAALQPREHGVEMLVVDALAGASRGWPRPARAISDASSSSSLCSAPDSLHVVLAVGGLDRERAVARRIVDLDRRRQRAAAQPFAGLDARRPWRSRRRRRRALRRPSAVFSPCTGTARRAARGSPPAVLTSAPSAIAPPSTRAKASRPTEPPWLTLNT